MGGDGIRWPAALGHNIGSTLEPETIGTVPEANDSIAELQRWPEDHPRRRSVVGPHGGFAVRFRNRKLPLAAVEQTLAVDLPALGDLVLMELIGSVRPGRAAC